LVFNLLIYIEFSNEIGGQTAADQERYFTPLAGSYPQHVEKFNLDNEWVNAV